MDENNNQSSMLGQIKDRITDPFLSNFLICFAIYNWKVLFVLLMESKSAIDRISYIEQHYYPDFSSIFEKIGTPFLISLLWFFIFPHIKRHIVSYHTKRKMEIEKGRFDIENDLKYSSRLSELERKEIRLISVEEFLIRKYKELKHYQQNNYRICKCKDVELGDWIHVSKDLERGSLAFLNKDFTNPATGVVVELLQNDYVLIQVAGLVMAREIGISDVTRKKGNVKLYLSNEPGKYQVGSIADFPINQRLGTFSGEADNSIFSISLANEQSSI
ncbi:hypothetical protein [Leptospira levettii]|uniref:hypothetical protein n=1 Tax=Leptospira levettii TaxID=2023178 RepID=UPI00223D878B|nr:hypothetical protein [Leptospira levettii]MCW7475547.1 hypothetical protein [Leptospira levettii]